MKRQALCTGWMFSRGNEAPRAVTLPHDAMLEEPRSANAPSGRGQAFFGGGSYRYERELEAPPEWEGKHVLVEFEGVYRHAQVFLNDTLVGMCAYGYRTFTVCLDKALRSGEVNRLVVTCDTVEQPDARWYSGAGIYRPVWLLVGPQHSLEPGDVAVTTVSADPPTVRVDVQDHDKDDVLVEILDGDAVLTSGRGSHATLPLPSAKLWSDLDPVLYLARVTINPGAPEEDVQTVNFGIRDVRVSPDGLFVNGRSVLLRGGCLHHDHGMLGAATNDESEWRRVRILRDAGFNAIRSSHYPCSRALPEACDALGVYVVDEAWDMWYTHKNAGDYAGEWLEHHEDDLRSMVRKDFNHPSVIMYSLGNELTEPASAKGLAKLRSMVRLMRALDSTRPVSLAVNPLILAAARPKERGKDSGRDTKTRMPKLNSTMYNFVANIVGSNMNEFARLRSVDEAVRPVAGELDLIGYNYARGRYVADGRTNPRRVIWGSETFPGDIARNWELVKHLPYVIGDFMWTAWDYLGEVGIGTWSYTEDGKSFHKPYPWLLGDTGAFDICGNPTGEAFLAKATWHHDEAPGICVRPLGRGRKPYKATWRATNAIPSWSWRGCEGEQATVEVYTHGTRVRLYLNDRFVGSERVHRQVARFHARYEPGELRAVAYGQGMEVLGESVLRTALGDLSPHVIPEKNTLHPGEIAYVRVALSDSAGIVESNADEHIVLCVEGGELLGFGSANPRTKESFHDGSYTTYYGQAVAVVRAAHAPVVTVSACTASGRQSACVIPVDMHGQRLQ